MDKQRVVEGIKQTIREGRGIDGLTVEDIERAEGWVIEENMAAFVVPRPGDQPGIVETFTQYGWAAGSRQLVRGMQSAIGEPEALEKLRGGRPAVRVK